MMYAHTDDDIYCTFYGGTFTTIPLGRGNIGIRQETGYPFDETVSLTVSPEKASQKFALHLRIPTWAGDRFVPGKLYSYVNRQPGTWSLTVNGKPAKVKVDKGFAVIDRKWEKGDCVAGRNRRGGSCRDAVDARLHCRCHSHLHMRERRHPSCSHQQFSSKFARHLHVALDQLAEKG